MTVHQPVMSPAKLSAIGALLVALGPVSMALYTPAMPDLVDYFQTNAATVKLTLTVYFAGFAAAQLICGPLSDAFGRRPVVMAFSGLYLVASVLAVLASDIGVLLAARAVQGIGAAAGVAISRAMVRDLYTGADSVRIMNLIGVMLSVGPAIAPTLGGITLELFGWRAIFLFMVLYGAAIVAVFLTVVPETLAPQNRMPPSPVRLLTNYGTLIRDRRFLRPSIIMGTTNGSFYALATMLPFVLIDEAGLTPTQFGVGMLAQTGSFLTGSLTVRQLLKVVDGRRLVPVGLGFIGAGGVLLAVLMRAVDPSFITVMGPVGLIAFGIAFTMPSTMTESLAPFPHMAGSAGALTGFMQMGGGLLGSAAAAAMGDPTLALGTVIPVMGAVGIAAYVGLRMPELPPAGEPTAEPIVERKSPAE